MTPGKEAYKRAIPTPREAMRYAPPGAASPGPRPRVGKCLWTEMPDQSAMSSQCPSAVSNYGYTFAARRSIFKHAMAH